MATKPVNRWLAPTSLLLLGALPIATGVMSLTSTVQGLAAGAPVNPDTVTYVAHPIPIFVHIVAGALMGLLGPFQFLASLRGQTWHRWSGRVFVVAMMGSVLIALWRIRQRDTVHHRAWMIRTYALGLGPATQRVVFLPYMFAFGLPEGPALGLMPAAGWRLNLGAAEWIIRRPAKRKQSPEVGLPASLERATA